MGLVVAFHFKLKMAFVPLAVGVGGIWLALWVVRTFPDFVGRIIAKMPASPLNEFLAELKLQILHGVTPGFLAILGLYTVACWLLYAATAFLFLLWVAALPLTWGQTAAVFIISSLGMAMELQRVKPCDRRGVRDDHVMRCPRIRAAPFG